MVAEQDGLQQNGKRHVLQSSSRPPAHIHSPYLIPVNRHEMFAVGIQISRTYTCVEDYCFAACFADTDAPKPAWVLSCCLLAWCIAGSDGYPISRGNTPGNSGGMVSWGNDWSRQMLLNHIAELRTEALKLRTEALAKSVSALYFQFDEQDVCGAKTTAPDLYCAATCPLNTMLSKLYNWSTTP